MKKAVLNLMRATGVFDLFRALHSGRALIITYHRFSSSDDSEHTPASIFNEQLAYLTAHYRVVPLSQLVELLIGEGTLPPRLAAITIDDGYRDAYEVAYPLLRRYQIPATLFVVTEFVEQRGWLWTDKMRFLTSQAHSQELMTAIKGEEFRVKLGDETSRNDVAEKINLMLKQLNDEAKDEAINSIAVSLGVAIPESPPKEYDAISWDQVREMDRKGVEIGSHTRTHPILTNISQRRLRDELTDSRTHLEAILKRRVGEFCYPNGDYDEQVRSEVIRAGYKSAVTIINGLNAYGDDLFSLRRIHTERDLTHFAQSISGFELMKDRVRRVMRKSLNSSTTTLSKETHRDNRGYKPVI